MVDRPARSRGPSTRTLGRVIAISVTLIFIGGLGLIVATRSGGPRTTDTAKLPDASRPTSGGQPPGVPQDITTAGISAMGKAKVQYMDRADPLRTLGLIEWEKLDPLPGGQSAVTSPKATIFLSPQSRIVVTAARGTLTARPPAVEPESGIFEGSVTAKLYITGDQVGGPTAPLAAGLQPALEFISQSLSFDLSLGELSVPGSFIVSGEGIDMAGAGIRLVANQARQRIELLRIDETSRLVLVPELISGLATKSRSAGLGAAAAAPQAISTANEPIAKAEPVEVLYRLVAGPNLTISRAGLSVRADFIEAFALTRESKLVPGAIKPLPALARGSALTGNPQLPAIPAAAAAPDPQPDESGLIPISITFSGPLELRPQTAMPKELSGALAGVLLAADAEVTGGALGLPRTRIAQSGQFEVLCDRVWYNATSPRAVFEPDATLGPANSTSPRFAAAFAGNLLRARSLTADLAKGSFSITGGGELQLGEDDAAASLPGPAQGRRVAWSDQADVIVLRAGDQLTDQPLSIVLQGEVRIAERAGQLEADALRADFAQVGTGRTALRQVKLTDAVSLRSANTQANEGGYLAGQAVTIDFAAPLGQRTQPVASMIVVIGDSVSPARAGRSSDELTAGMIEAQLGTDEAGRPEARTLRAERDARYTDAAGTVVACDVLSADVPSQIIDLVGPTSSIARGGVQITGSQMRLDGLRRELYVHGAGALVATARGGTRVRTTWTEYLRFDDVRAFAETRGSTLTSITRGELEQSEITAESLRMTLSASQGSDAKPDSASATASAQVAPQFLTGTSREVLSLEAIGAAVGMPGGAKATIELRKFAAGGPTEPSVGPPAARSLDQLLYVEADRMIASPKTQIVSLPGPGRLLVDDLRARVSVKQEQGAASLPTLASPNPANLFTAGGSGSGTTLITWTQSAEVNQATGFISAVGGIDILHRARDTTTPLRLRADRADAVLAPDPATTGNSPTNAGGQLRSAAASGNVELIAPDGKTLRGGRINFDAISQEVAAFGDVVEQSLPDPTNPARVTLSDPAQPVPAIARAMRWNLRTGRIEIIEPMPVSIPR